MSNTTNDLLSLQNNNNSEISQNQHLKKEEINKIISLFLLKRTFISFKKRTINL